MSLAKAPSTETLPSNTTGKALVWNAEASSKKIKKVPNKINL
jgi:hypothetical protein